MYTETNFDFLTDTDIFVPKKHLLLTYSTIRWCEIFHTLDYISKLLSQYKSASINVPLAGLSFRRPTNTCSHSKCSSAYSSSDTKLQSTQIKKIVLKLEPVGWSFVTLLPTHKTIIAKSNREGWGVSRATLFKEGEVHSTELNNNCNTQRCWGTYKMGTNCI